MNRLQKIMWMMMVCLVVSGIAVFVLFMKDISSAWLQLVFGAICVAGCLAGHAFFKKEPGPTQIDERDKAIQLKATRISMTIAYVLFVLLCIGLWVYYHYRGIQTISIDILTILIWPPALCLFLVNAVVTLSLYGKNSKSTEGGAA
jgi:hypothetical protein